MEESIVKHFLCSIKGEDANREGLLETPKRVSKMYDELLTGYNQTGKDVLKTFENPNTDDKYARGIIAVGSIQFYSLCEHHIIPFFGKAYIAYIPKDRIVGLSKFARLVDVYSHRLQVQERMTAQIIDTIVEVLQPQAAIVVLEAEHLCMAMRGIRRTGAITRTSRLYGDFITDEKARNEAMRLLGL